MKRGGFLTLIAAAPFVRPPKATLIKAPIVVSWTSTTIGAVGFNVYANGKAILLAPRQSAKSTYGYTLTYTSAPGETTLG